MALKIRNRNSSTICRGKELLLVLDSFEHLLPAKLDASGVTGEGLDLLLDILKAAPGIEIVITSRTPLQPSLGVRAGDPGVGLSTERRYRGWNNLCFNGIV